jgi:hypothetical protein
MNLISFDVRTNHLDDTTYVHVTGEVREKEHTVIRIETNVALTAVDGSKSLYELQRQLLALALKALQADLSRLPEPAAAPTNEATTN